MGVVKSNIFNKVVISKHAVSCLCASCNEQAHVHLNLATIVHFSFHSQMRYTFWPLFWILTGACAGYTHGARRRRNDLLHNLKVIIQYIGSGKSVNIERDDLTSIIDICKSWLPICGSLTSSTDDQY